MKAELRQLIQQAKSRKEENVKFFQKIKSNSLKSLDTRFHVYHEEVFQEINCLDCANCCKTTSPIFYDKDVERAASFLKIKAVDFETKYLKQDEEGDLVLKSSPCSFLMDDNKCLIYEARPKACREYPHTNRKRMHQILDLTLKNSTICPAVAEIVKRFKDTREEI